MSSQDIVVREPVLLPLEDYLGATPIPHLPLENTDKFYKLYMERDDGILSLYNRPGDANFGHWGGTWCQALPDEADKPPMCQYINESLDNIAPVVLPQERWMRRATDYLTHLCPYEYIQVQSREMMKIWPVDQMPAWVPVLRERWLIVKRAKKENRDAWETWLQRCESSNDESLLQVARKEREEEARRLHYQELAKVRNRDQLIAKHQARREYVAVVRAAEKEREQQQKDCDPPDTANPRIIPHFQWQVSLLPPGHHLPSDAFFKHHSKAIGSEELGFSQSTTPLSSEHRSDCERMNKCR
ncbi:hypothetical protein D6C83_06711 [Aureobasidium pullulans]|uniref:Uncharacterized protein n=1 Tax=Aureobasidium pullulans TaxID=5580 RepID=A0A4T0BUD3_AURPU|nr:hypothetical protein D6C83_06711 [Aureobasidium pullulans]